MADDLGDFFAKKDKRKKKKGVTSATLIEQLHHESSNPEEQLQAPPLNPTAVARPDDGEWIEINNDNLAEGLSDLKIKSLDAKEEEEEGARELDNQQVDSEDEANGEHTGPWAPLSNTPPKTRIEPPKANVPSIPSSLVSSGGKYIPPSQRSNAQSIPRRGREQLNVNSVEQFPDLSMGATKPKERHDPTFDMAKGGGRKVQQQARPETVQLNNKFKVLES